MTGDHIDTEGYNGGCSTHRCKECDWLICKEHRVSTGCRDTMLCDEGIDTSYERGLRCVLPRGLRTL